MKKTLAAVLGSIVCVVLLSGCATPYPQGVAYTNLRLPIAVTEQEAGKKVGIAESRSYFGLVATGDSSIQAAMRNGRITRVSHVDWEVENILGLIGTYRTIVHGE